METISQPVGQEQTSNGQAQQVAAAAVAAPIAPLPMSFPALLLNPRSKTTHLVHPKEIEDLKPMRVTTTLDGKTRGKRRIRRFENVTFRENPHVVQPSQADYQISHTSILETFPRPVPSYLRSSSAPSGAILSRSEPESINSAYAGRFTMGLRGIRRELRQRGSGRARMLAEDIEKAIQQWLNGNGTEDEAGDVRLNEDGIDRCDPPVIVQVSSNPLEMVWRTEDPFARWIIHCVCRWHSVVSFSKDLVVEPEGGLPSRIQRQTHLLRPNSRHPDPRALGAVYTPTATDLETSAIDTDGSEVGDLADSLSSLHVVGAVEAAQARHALEVVAEGEGDAEAFSDAESTFSFVEHPSMTDSISIDKNVTGNTDVNNNTDKDLAGNMKHSPNLEGPKEEEQRPVRTLERIEEIFREDGVARSGSGSSPSRSPRRRPRRVRRIVAPRRSQGVFRSVEPPSTFIAYVYGA